MAINAFLLTRQAVESNGRLTLRLWAATNEGPLLVEIESAEAVCFFERSQTAAVEQALAKSSGWRLSEVGLKNFAGGDLSALYVSGSRAYYRIVDRLRAAGILLYESDIAPADRYLMERYVCGPFKAHGGEKRSASKGHLRLAGPGLKPARYQPTLFMLSIDIETSWTDGVLYSIAAHGYRPGTNSASDNPAEVERVFMIGTAPAPRDGQETAPHIEYCENEATCLSAFLAWLREVDPDVLIGWNVVNFDLRFLDQVASRVGVPFEIGRGGAVPLWRRSAMNPNWRTCIVPGRAVIDGIDTMRTAGYVFESFSLENVAQELLGRGKKIEHVDDRANEIQELFATDKPALAAYNLEDCRLVSDIFVQEGLLEFSIERSALTGLPLGRNGGSVAAFDYLYLPRLHREGVAAPSVVDVVSEGASPGGYVLDSRPGIFDNVLLFDFKSLYPSIIRSFFIDPLALHRAEEPGVERGQVVPGFDGAGFHRPSAILPRIISELWAARDRAKRERNAALSQAIKIIMNSFYGVLGTPGCRCYDHRLASSITRRGHEILKESRTFFESLGYEVLYGDTDSLFVRHREVHAGQDSIAALIEDAERTARRMNAFWTTKLERELGVQSRLELEFEALYLKFFMPAVRGSAVGSKKRYAGLRHTGLDAPPELVFKGLESVRSDWTRASKDFQASLYARVFADAPFEDVVVDAVTRLRSGALDEQLVLRKRLRRPLDEYERNVPPHVQAARKAETIRQGKGLPPLYEQGSTIEYVFTREGPQPSLYASAPLDYELYIERQLKPVADAILTFCDTDFDHIVGGQKSLF